jgi:hypothetical protein
MPQTQGTRNPIPLGSDHLANIPLAEGSGFTFGDWQVRRTIMSHKRSNMDLRGERLAVELSTSLDSADWQAEEERQQLWGKPRPLPDDDDFDIKKIIDEGFNT